MMARQVILGVMSYDEEMFKKWREARMKFISDNPATAQALALKVPSPTYRAHLLDAVILRVVPCDLKTANEFVRRLHRHSRPVVGHKFAVGVEACTRAAHGEAWALVGVAIVGRPVAPRLDDGKAAEITRLCTDGTRNACSMLYGAARRAARALGHAPTTPTRYPKKAEPVCEPLDSGSTKRTRAEAPRCGTTGPAGLRSPWGTTSSGASGDGLAEA
jgi:hypothetical protein